MKTFHRVMLAPVCAIACLLVLGTFSWLSQKEQIGNLKDINERHNNVEITSTAAQKIGNTHANIYRLLTWISNYDAQKLSAIAAEEIKSVSDIQTQLESLAAASVREKEKAILQELADHIGKYKKEITQATDMASVDVNIGMAAMQSADQIYSKIRVAFDTLLSIEQNNGKIKVSEARSDLENTQDLMITITIVAVIIGLGIAFRVSRSLTGALGGEPEYAASIAQYIADGELTINVASSTIKQQNLLRSLDAMRIELLKIIGNINKEAQQLHSSATRVSASAQQVAKSSEEQSGASSSMAAATEEMITSIAHMSDISEQAFVLTQESGKMSVAGSEAIHQFAQRIGETSKVIGDTSKTIATLGQHSEQIFSIVQVIKEVADQTNLLALNAAIEAARAGEQGRGFAVVADEVRKLAERTTQATIQIRTMIESIQHSAQVAVQSMEGTVASVEESTRTFSDTSNLIDSIKTNTALVAHIVEDIAHALREQKLASSEISASVERISDAIDRNSSSATETAKEANSLETLSYSLRQSLARFKT